MSKKKTARPLADYADLLQRVKSRIRHSQTRAVFAANAELIQLYWDIGRMIDTKQDKEGWGAGVIPRLAKDLRDEFMEVKGFSERNIKRMLRFYRAYPDPAAIVPQLAAQLPPPKKSMSQGAKSASPAIVPQLAAQLPPPKKSMSQGAKSASPAIVPQLAAQLRQPIAKVDAPKLSSQPQEITQQPVAYVDGSLLWSIPWFHHVILLEKVKDFGHRTWYMRQTLEHSWSRNILLHHIRRKAHARQGKAITNMPALSPSAQSEIVVQLLKDPYIFDFLTLTEPFHERELETQLLHHLERFLIELGKGFAFVGRQYRIEVGDEDFSIDLLFYHLKLRCYVVIDLKIGAFQPDYAGKMNFYLNVVDAKLKHDSDARSIGLILCQDRNRVVAE